MEPPSNFTICNRLSAAMAHTSRYAFKGQARLAQDAGVSRSTISRLINGQSHPFFGLAITLTRLLGQHVGRRLDPCDLFSITGTYPTPSVCDLCGCPGCLPQEAYDENDERLSAYQCLEPGQWSSVDAAVIRSVATS